MKNKILKTFLPFAFCLLPFASHAKAANFSITCDGHSCSTLPHSGAALFEEPDVKPGYNIYRQITVTNNGTDDCSLHLNTNNFNDPNNLRGVLFTAINGNGTDWFGDSSGGYASASHNFSDLQSTGEIHLGTVLKNGGVNNYDWLVTMDPNAGNTYQGRTMKFDFDLTFECRQPESLCPNLSITKNNDKKDKHIFLWKGDRVYYTITVTNNSDFEANNVVVHDVQPPQTNFDYEEDSGKLTKPGGSPQPITATGTNPFFWSLGNIPARQTYTLTYSIKILSVDIPGLHFNLAVAYSDNGHGGHCFSEPVIDPFDIGLPGLTGGFSGQQIVETTGGVLGASTFNKAGQVLGAATGSPTFWLILAIALILSGSVLKIIRKRKRHPYLTDTL